MPTNGPNGIQIQIGGDATPLERDIAAAKAKVEAESSTTKVGAGSSKAAAEVQAIAKNAQDATTSLNQMGTAANNAVGPTSNTATGLKSLNKTLGDTIGQVQGLFAKLTMVVGTATGFFALGRAIREAVSEELKTGTERAEEFTEALSIVEPRKRVEEYDKKLQEVNAQLAVASDRAEAFSKANENLARSFAGIGAQGSENGLTVAQNEVKKLQDEQKKLLEDSKNDRALVKALDTRAAENRLEESKRIYREELNARIDASAEYNARVDKALEDEATARERQIQDFRDEMRQLGDEMEKQARRSQQAWETSLRAIREASNAAFNTDNARSMVELAGNLNATATTATANMNRIIVGGTD